MEDQGQQPASDPPSRKQGRASESGPTVERTSTTKARLNEFGPVSISQAQGIWYAGREHTFADGMIAKSDGTLVGAGPDPKAVRKARTRVREFAREFIRRLRAGEIPLPSGGDCWECLLFAQDGGKPSPEHIHDHIKHGYFVPSLLVRALEWRGSVAMRSVAFSRFHGVDQETKARAFPESDWLWRDIVKTLTRYCYLQLGMTV